jgi:DNA helicase IV
VVRVSRPEAPARYDFVVVDEVQDLTNVQLALALRTLRKPGRFLLCGDSNQVVHPNFFSWTQLKTLFFGAGVSAPGELLHVLRANYRNAAGVVGVANRLLRIKQPARSPRRDGALHGQHRLP